MGNLGDAPSNQPLSPANIAMTTYEDVGSGVRLSLSSGQSGNVPGISITPVAGTYLAMAWINAWGVSSTGDYQLGIGVNNVRSEDFLVRLGTGDADNGHFFADFITVDGNDIVTIRATNNVGGTLDIPDSDSDLPRQKLKLVRIG